MNEEDRIWIAARGRTQSDTPVYTTQADGRALLKVIATVGDIAYAATPWHPAGAPMALPATAIAADCDLPLEEVTGREFTARGNRDGLSDYRLVFDPRR
ncbi:hypothetical protein AB0L82_35940 [Nocardia sp. NPDC052001]|uniref:hypothetical protein n=1 Tax=Nocardia sp. NPDC052001 TaxID=3154853 RepID=UPI0034266BCA